ncbi:MAG: GGDEF domain-containing protein [Synergistaceae bacterium]|jgi:diguanylate cyclase (GGDEF)-like protein/PAS domain S-box-containing protein|nr:GGDEF domain-containing protein [Synergistaceae bacterium]
MFDPKDLSPEEKRFLDNMINGVCLIDNTKCICFWNESAVEITGFSVEESIGKACPNDVVAGMTVPEPLCENRCPFLTPQQCEKPAVTDIRLRHKNGYAIPARMRCAPIIDKFGQMTGVLEVFERSYGELSMSDQLEDMRKKAYIDTVTRIPNRRFAEEAIFECLDALRQNGRGFSVLMGDIDFFKSVNDTYGHDAGDAVLAAVADTLRSGVRSLDVVSRWGGEEFLVILRDANNKAALYRAENLRKAVAEKIIKNDDNAIAVTISFGGTTAHKGDTAESLIGRADECLYKSKEDGRNRVTISN